MTFDDLSVTDPRYPTFSIMPPAYGRRFLDLSRDGSIVLPTGRTRSSLDTTVVLKETE